MEAWETSVSECEAKEREAQRAYVVVLGRNMTGGSVITDKSPFDADGFVHCPHCGADEFAQFECGNQRYEINQGTEVRESYTFECAACERYWQWVETWKGSIR